MELVILVFVQSVLLAGVSLYAVRQSSGARQIRDLHKQLDSMLDRLAAVDWREFHASRMDQQRQLTQNAAIAYSGPGPHGYPTPEEMETYAS